MPRSVTLFTGQWADLPIAELLPRVKEMGFDGVELACWGDHFDVAAALNDPAYIPALWELLSSHDLSCWSISNHLVGQAVCDRIDERHKAILPPEIWGDGDEEGVRQRAAQRMIETAQACRKFMDARPGGAPERLVVNGFTGSSIWGALYAFPPTNQDYLNAGYIDFAARFGPIMDGFDSVDVDFGLEVHPTEIAFDSVTAQRALDALGGHPRFGFNYDPSHLAYQGVDYVDFIRRFGSRIFHAHMKDVWWNAGDGSVGVFGGHTDFGDARRFWDFRSVGRGHVDFERIMVALNDIHYTGPLSIEWEDARMDRFHGATESCAFVKKLDFPPSGLAFDAAFEKSKD
jgi:sugar phosphate isomerase/epimerase